MESVEYIDEVSIDGIIEKLSKLAERKKPVLMNEIPSEILEAFKEFMIGRTISIKDGIQLVNYSDYFSFYKKIWT